MPTNTQSENTAAVTSAAERVPNVRADATILRMSNADLTAAVFAGNKTGNLFKVVRVEPEGESRFMVYVKPGKTQGYRLELSLFASRFHVATAEELWASLSDMSSQIPEGDGEAEVGFMTQPDERHDLTRIVLYDETREAIQIGLTKILRAKDIEEVWGMSKIEPRGNRCVLNFYGPAGTGKTLSAMAIARMLNRPVYQIDYSQIISKYIGDTAKHIKQAFKRAREENAILFFDEADSLLSRRVGMEDGGQRSWATSINQNRNVLMQELDKFDGVVIMTTNMFSNYDEAILRRIAQHVPFRLPCKTMRRQLFDLHLPNKDHVKITEEEWEKVCVECKGFSGGDVLNAVVNAITRASLSEDKSLWNLTKIDLLVECARIVEAKAHHAASKGPKKLGPKVEPAGGTDTAAGPEKNVLKD